MLNLVGVFGTEHSTRTQIELKDGFMISDTPKIKDDCVCQKSIGMVKD